MKNKEALNNFPESLRLLPQWILWKYETKDDGKITKVPYQINGKKAAVNRPDEWSKLEECISVADDFDGIGFVFTDGYIGIDLDKCFEYDGTLKQFAQDVLLTFDSYTEVSPSGNGLHVIIESDVHLDGRKKNGIECYATGRFFTVTGNVYAGRTQLKDCDIIAWHKEIFGEKPTAKPASTTTGYLPEDTKILKVMFSSKGGARVEDLYGGNWQKYYSSQSEADLSLVGSLMFFSRNDMATVDRLFRGSKLMREKWDEKHGAETYGQRTMILATKTDVMEWKEPERTEFIMTSGKNPVPMLVLENVCIALEDDTEFCSRFRFNDFSHTIETLRGNRWDILQDNDVLDAERYISRKWIYFAKIPKEMTVDAIRQMAHRTKINPPVDYLRALVWDKMPRLGFWLHCTFGSPNDELHEKMGENWMKGLVSRVLNPGCQFDQVLVLEGPQGWFKSSALRILGNPWHVESTLSTDDTDFYMLLARNVIVEFSEGEIVGRTSARRLKAIITKTEDTYRAPYERGHQTYKRGCVFAMTTNDNDYQKDETGGRRWLPIVLKKKADIGWLRENRDQLYAEAVYRAIELKETLYEYPEDELKDLQGEKAEFDEISESIQRWFRNLPDEKKHEGVLTLDAYNGALNTRVDGDLKELPQQMTWRIGKVFRTILKLRNENRRINGEQRKRWFLA